MWIEPESDLVVFRSLIEVVLLFKDTRDIGLNAGGIRLSFQCLPIPVQGRGQIAFFLLGLAHIVVSHRQTWAQAHGRAVTVLGLRKATQLAKDIAQVVLGLSQIGAQADGFQAMS
jgi:hypothetical protein